MDDAACPVKGGDGGVDHGEAVCGHSEGDVVGGEFEFEVVAAGGVFGEDGVVGGVEDSWVGGGGEVVDDVDGEGVVIVLVDVD